MSLASARGPRLPGTRELPARRVALGEAQDKLGLVAAVFAQCKAFRGGAES
jgi:hypothetical protein